MIKPLNNNCLIEVIDDYAGVIRNTEQENVQKGVLRDIGLSQEHLTASTGHKIDGRIMADISNLYGTGLSGNGVIGKTVYWQEYADAGSKFEIEGKKYVLVPWYRLIGFEE